jgi:hypothetical protein
LIASLLGIFSGKLLKPESQVCQTVVAALSPEEPELTSQSQLLAGIYPCSNVLDQCPS